MLKKEFDIVLFCDNDISIEVNIDKKNDTVWLSQKQMSDLFNVSTDIVGIHIENILSSGELDLSAVEERFVFEKDGNQNVKRKITFYNLDMIISIGYRVNSKKIVLFRKWAESILKKYLISKESKSDEKIIFDEDNKILETIKDYDKALSLLDDYDHQTLIKPNGTFGCYKITYKECRKIIDSMKFDSDIFGIEKDGSFNSSINAIYQSAFGEDVYKSIEEKAANLLYFITKNHSFVDGNKRIAATIFLYFLDKNNLLYINGNKRLSDSALVATTILIAESKPEEKEIIINLIMNFLTM